MTDHIGTLTIDGDRATITFVRHLPYPIEEVWAAITEPARRAAWFGDTTIDGRVGGRIEMVPTEPPAPPEKKRMTGRILDWDPPRVLEHEWQQSIVEDSAGTILTFTHRGMSVRNAQGFTPGSHAFLDRLEAHLAGEQLPEWDERCQQVAPLYPAWS